MNKQANLVPADIEQRIHQSILNAINGLFDAAVHLRDLRRGNDFATLSGGGALNRKLDTLPISPAALLQLINQHPTCEEWHTLFDEPLRAALTLPPAPPAPPAQPPA